MKRQLIFLLSLVMTIASWPIGIGQRASASDEIVSEITAVEEAFAEAFNAANADAVIGMFLPEGEIVDDSGIVYQGRTELKELFSTYFTNFPGAKLALQIESVRSVGQGLAIEEGTRYLSTADEAFAQVRYVATLLKQDGKWLLASIREFYDEPEPTCGDHLAPLAWLEGDWVSEGSDLAVRISYRWDEDGNFLLGKFHATREGEVILKTDQRIGWDPLAGKVRSWLFDSDGGFGGGVWTQVDESWVVKSEATEPSGAIGTATVTFTQLDKDHFRMVGTDRIIGDERADDFDVTVTRAPPKPTGVHNANGASSKESSTAPSR